MAKLKIRNWEQFQHYKDRCPPWIKLHFETLSSEDWVKASDKSKLLMLVCMLVASRNDGEVPEDPEYLKRVGQLRHLPDLNPLKQSGFFELQADASAIVQASAIPRALARGEKRRDREEERRGEEERARGASPPFDDFWNHYPRKVGKLAALKAWKKIGPGKSLSEQIINAITNQVNADHFKGSNGGSFIPNPATWLNRGQWDDEIQHRKTSADNLAELEALAKEMEARK